RHLAFTLFPYTTLFRSSRSFIRSNPDPIAKRVIGPNDVHLYRSPGHTQDFVNCVFSRQRPICDVEIGARSVTVCHLVNIAYWLRSEEHTSELQSRGHLV